MIIGMKTQVCNGYEGVMTFRATQKGENYWVLESRLDKRMDGFKEEVDGWAVHNTTDSLISAAVIATRVVPQADSIAIHPVWEQAETVASKQDDITKNLQRLTELEMKLRCFAPMEREEKYAEQVESELKRRRLYKKACEGKLSTDKLQEIKKPFFDRFNKDLEQINRICDRIERLKKRWFDREKELVTREKRGIFGLSQPTTSGDEDDENARWT